MGPIIAWSEPIQGFTCIVEYTKPRTSPSSAPSAVCITETIGSWGKSVDLTWGKNCLHVPGIKCVSVPGYTVNICSRKAYGSTGTPGSRWIPWGGEILVREGGGVLRGEHGAHGRDTGLFSHSFIHSCIFYPFIQRVTIHAFNHWESKHHLFSSHLCLPQI